MPKASPRRGQLVLVLSLAALGVVTLLAVVAADTATVVRQGDLLPWGGDNIRQVDLAGSEVYLSSEFSFRIDDLTSWTLIAIGGVAALGASLVGFGAGRTWQMLTLSAAAATWLGLDEGLALHETIGHNLGFLADLPGVRAPDDVIFALYVILAIAFAVAYRDLLAASRIALGLFAAGVAIAALAGVLDASSLDSSRSRREDVIETAAGLVLLAGYVALVRALVRRELGVPAPAG
jgi:hypothetical protein